MTYLDNQQRIVDALREVGPMTASELCDFLTVHRTTIGKFIKRLREARKVRIHHYLRGRREPAPVYALGAAKDAAWEPMAQAERTARYRARIPHVLRARRRTKPASPWDLLKA